MRHVISLEFSQKSLVRCLPNTSSGLTTSFHNSNYEKSKEVAMAGTTGENTESPSMSPRNEPARKPPRNRLSCQVTLLDGTILTTDQLQVRVFL